MHFLAYWEMFACLWGEQGAEKVLLGFALSLYLLLPIFKLENFTGFWQYSGYFGSVYIKSGEN